MLSCSFFSPAFLMALCASLVQTAPTDFSLMRINRYSFPAGVVSYALIDKREFIPELEQELLKEGLEQEDVNVLEMQFLQLNMMKILFFLDVIILICIYVYIIA